jgi:tryptophan-rich sensory protein
MAVVSFLQAKLIYKVYIAQLILNGAWSWIFFAHQALTLALFDIIILIILNVIILHKLWTNNSYVSFFLYLPYVLWISFASYLNANIVFLN